MFVLGERRVEMAGNMAEKYLALAHEAKKHTGTTGGE